MSTDNFAEKPEKRALQKGAGLKRRDLLLSGSLLVAALALSVVGLTNTAQAQQRPAAKQAATGSPRTRRKTPQHPCHHGRRCRLVQHRRLPSRNDVGEDAEPRQARVRRHDVHGLLRRSKLYGGPGELHHRRVTDPHRADDRGSGRGRRRHAGAGCDARDSPQGTRLCYRAVRQKPPR